MNLVLPFEPQITHPNASNLGLESARVENAEKNAIPAIDTSSHSNQANSNSTFAQPDSSAQYADRVTLSQNAILKNKTAEDQNENSLSEEEQKQVQELKDRDREVKIHEQAHAAVGGQYAGAPSYEYETGPDGKRYAVGGEVSIDVSEEPEPKDTIQKMQIVRAAALAPAEPSTQDLKVAAEASQKENQARAQLSQQQLGSTSSANSTHHDHAMNTVEDTSTSATNTVQLKKASAYLDDYQKVSSSFGVKA